MSQAGEARYFIAWKGANTGPFTLAQIQEKLAAGEVSRMHQVQVDGRWVSVDEFLSRHEAAERRVTKAREEKAGLEEMRLRQEYEARSASGQAQQQSLAEQLRAADQHTRQMPAPGMPPPPPYPPLAAPPFHAPAFPGAEATRTSGFAITGIICAVCNFVPYLNYVAWIPALVFGHVALRDIGNNPALAGRGLAIATLCITYFIVIVGLTIVVLRALDGGFRF
jgi:hypothetical protein